MAVGTMRRVPQVRPETRGERLFIISTVAGYSLRREVRETREMDDGIAIGRIGGAWGPRRSERGRRRKGLG
jgi:hypothetical protein